MPKLTCSCGHVHDLSPIPDAGWITVRDADYDRLVASERARDELASRDGGVDSADFARVDGEISALTGVMYECPACGRLLWRPPWETEFRAYVRGS